MIKGLEKKEILTYFAGAIALLLLAFIFSNYSRTSQEKVDQTTMAPTETTKQEDTVNDGVYTNYKYGFKFEYPEEIFVSQNVYGSSGMWFIDEETSSPMAVGVTGVWMDLVIRDFESDKPGDYEYQRGHDRIFNRLYELEPGEVSSWNAKVISKINAGDVKRIKYYYETLPGREYSVSYFAWWKKAGLPVISLGLAANNNDTLSLYRNDFDKIVESFEFFEVE